MAKDKSERLMNAHNEGEKDAANGEYHPKSNLLSELGASSDDHEIADAYAQGWRNAKDQKDNG